MLYGTGTSIPRFNGYAHAVRRSDQTSFLPHPCRHGQERKCASTSAARILEPPAALVCRVPAPRLIGADLKTQMHLLGNLPGSAAWKYGAGGNWPGGLRLSQRERGVEPLLIVGAGLSRLEPMGLRVLLLQKLNFTRLFTACNSIYLKGGARWLFVCMKLIQTVL